MKYDLGLIEFQKVTAVDDQLKPLLLNCDFKFPMGLNCRIVSEEIKHETHLLQLMSNLVQPAKGEILYNDHKLSQMTFEEFLPWQLKMSFGFESSGLLSNRTLEQNLMLPVNFHNKFDHQEAKAWVTELINRFGIYKYKDLRPADANPFVRKACLVARSFVMKSETIFLDDPDVSLEKNNIPVLLDLVEEMRRAGNLKNLFFCSQSEELSECLLTSVVKLSGGKLKSVYIHHNFQKAVGI